ncbi:MAG: ATP-binding cassette domain-containing protein [Eubacteriales bacterium]
MLIDLLNKIELSLKKFPQGLDTLLSREFGTGEMFGGEWQCVAIARGMYSDHKLIVLDEPTAAIDPLEESKLFQWIK